VFGRKKKKAKRTTRSRRRVIYAKNRQTGTSVRKIDARRRALPPGKRRSASGRVYYEYRKNRTDKKGRRI